MKSPQVGDVLSGTVVRVYSSYAILLFEDGSTGLLHISELSNNFVRSFTSFVTIGTIYSVKVIAIEEEKGNIRVSLKRMNSSDRRKTFRHERIDPESVDFSLLAEKLPEWIAEENKQ